MKKLIIILSVLFCAFIAEAEGLNSNAGYIKKNYSSDYELTLKKYALAEWKEDYSMVVYEINKQADALVKLTEEFKSENTNIAFKAIQEWSIEGYKSKNISHFNKMKSFGLKDLLKLHCDWSMVKYEFDKQVKSKNAF